MRRHHDEIDLVVMGVVNDNLRGVASFDYSVQVKAREMMAHKTAHLVSGSLLNLLVTDL
jgi:hypothetical protein